jgi:hypothetical protein
MAESVPMADTIISILPTAVEEISTPLLISGVPRAVVETYPVEVAVLLWDATDPVPPVPDGGTSWAAAWWDTDAPETTVQFRVGPGTSVGSLTAQARYRTYVRIVGGGNTAIEDIGTIVVGLLFTYSGSPATSPRDAVRFEVGDTAPAWAFSDAEVDYALAANPGAPLAAAADLADTLAMRYGKEYESETNGDQQVAKGKRWASMLALADRLRDRAAHGDVTAPPTESFFADLELGDEEGRGKPQFVLGQMDNRGGPG